MLIFRMFTTGRHSFNSKSKWIETSIVIIIVYTFVVLYVTVVLFSEKKIKGGVVNGLHCSGITQSV